MDPEQKHVNQRKSYRCQVPDGQEYAELRVGRRRTPIRLFNESAGGFAALVPGDLRVKTNDVLELISAMGRFEVRVAYVSKVTQASSGKGQEEPLLRIGLEHLDDSSASARETRPHHAKSNLPMTTILAVSAVALVIVAGISGTAALTSRPDGLVRPMSDTNGKLALPGLGSEPAPDKRLAEIGLSDAQHQQIQAAAATVAETFQELDGQWNADTPEQRARKQAAVWGAARREILDRLTDEQRSRWEQSVQ